jgi:hypothetical protein
VGQSAALAAEVERRGGVIAAQEKQVRGEGEGACSVVVGLQKAWGRRQQGRRRGGGVIAAQQKQAGARSSVCGCEGRGRRVGWAGAGSSRGGGARIGVIAAALDKQMRGA